MDLPRGARKATVAALGVGVLLGALAGCGGSGGDEAETTSGGEAASRLNQAQLIEFGDAKLLAEQSETGAYGTLTAVRQMDQLRGGAELDKPQCMDAVNQWGKLPEVREAPASLATFGSERETITHMLIELPPEVAEEAIATAPPEECASYEATMEEGTPATYTVRDLDIETVGEESRAFVVETDVEGEKVLLYSVLYRNGDYLGTTSLLGGPDGEQRLTDFSTAALERENTILNG